LPVQPPSGASAVLGTEHAPFIYFDGVLTFGVNHGAVQLELAANVIVPVGTGTRTDIVTTAHIRCSPNAAAGLKEMLEKVLEMLKNMAEQAGSPPAAAPGSRLN